MCHDAFVQIRVCNCFLYHHPYGFSALFCSVRDWKPFNIGVRYVSSMSMRIIVVLFCLLEFVSCYRLRSSITGRLVSHFSYLLRISVQAYNGHDLVPLLAWFVR